MRNRDRLRVAAVVALLAAWMTVACVGCKDGQQGNGPDEGNGPTPVDPPTPVPVEGPSGRPTEEPPPKPTIPEVALTQAQQDTCLVGVGDTMPDGELPDLDANTRSLDKLRGECLTVVVFWSPGESEQDKNRAQFLLEDLEADVVQACGDKGARVIAISEDAAAEGVAELARLSGVSFPVLLDSGGQYFAKVATEGLPRIYLLGAKGKVVWLDLEYSETTRDKLLLSIGILLEGTEGT